MTGPSRDADDEYRRTVREQVAAVTPKPKSKTRAQPPPSAPSGASAQAAADIVARIRPSEQRKANSGTTLVNDHDHMARARAFIDAKRPHLLHWRDDFVDYKAGRYEIVSDKTIRADIYEHHSQCIKVVKNKETDTFKRVAFEPNTKIVHETICAAQALCHVLPTINQPAWLTGSNRIDPEHLVSFPNGILNLTTGVFLPPDPALFTASAVGFPYDPRAPKPVNFIGFLEQVFDGDQRQEQIGALRELFGYCLTPSINQEKAFMLLGPKRSGKDTIRNTLQSLLPAGAVCGPTLDSLGTNFGMSSLIGRSLAIIGDMRIGSKADRDLLTENILKLTGRGLFTIDRKHQSHWHGELACKLLLISNEQPQLKDTSGALASRFIVLLTRVSFYGREDPNLFRDKIKPELPGILNWALDGLRSMMERGKLVEPASSIEERTQLAREGSPVLAFVAERLKFDPKAETDKDAIYRNYHLWSQEAGMPPKDKSVFMRELWPATGGKVEAAKRTDKDSGLRVPVVRGVSIKTDQDQQDGPP